MPRTKQFDEQAVLEKAVSLFWKQGYNGTSMQELVDHLGINRASLYATYGGKRALFDLAIDHYRKQGQAALWKALEQLPSARAKLEYLFEQAIDDSVKDTDRKGCFVVNTVSESACPDLEVRAMLEENRINFEQVFAELILSGREQGEWSSSMNVADTASYLYAFYNGLRVVSRHQNERTYLEGMVRTALTVLDQ